MVSINTTPYGDDGLSQARGKDIKLQYFSVNAIEMDEEDGGRIETGALVVRDAKRISFKGDNNRKTEVAR